MTRKIIIAAINARHSQHDVDRVVIKRDGSVHAWQRPKYGGQSRVNVFVGWASDLLAETSGGLKNESLDTVHEHAPGSGN